MLQGITVTYYWDDTIAQVIISVHHGGVMSMVKVHYVRFDINIMGIFGCSLLMLKWMIIFVLLQVRLGNVGVSFVHFTFSVKCSNKPNAGIDFS